MSDEGRSRTTGDDDGVSVVSQPTPLYGPTGEVLAEVVVPPFPIEHSSTSCPCGGLR